MRGRGIFPDNYLRFGVCQEQYVISHESLAVCILRSLIILGKVCVIVFCVFIRNYIFFVSTHFEVNAIICKNTSEFVCTLDSCNV